MYLPPLGKEWVLFFFLESFNLWHPLLMIDLYRQTKTLISFWYRRRLTLRSLIQPSEILTIELMVWCKVIFSTTLSSAVRPKPSLYYTSIFWSNMRFSAVYKVWLVGFGLIYFSKFWAGLAKSKIDFFSLFWANFKLLD